MSRNDGYTTGNLLDYLVHQKYYKLIDIDLSRQVNMNFPQEIIFVGKLDEDDGATMFFCCVFFLLLLLVCLFFLLKNSKKLFT